MINYKSPRQAIEWVVNDYFKRKDLLNRQRTGNSTRRSAGLNTVIGRENLPEMPFVTFKNNDNRVEKIIYGNIELLQQQDIEADVVVWQQEFIRENDRVVQIKTTYPDGETNIENILRDTNGRVTGMS